MKLAFAKFLILSGSVLLLLSTVLLYERFKPGRLSFPDYREEAEISEGGILQPEYLIIKNLGINLPIYDANPPDNGRWETTYKGISHLNSTPKPGTMGNSVLYGHNWKSLLGNLNKAEVGQEIEIVYKNGAVEKYIISYIQVVEPTQSDILKQTEDKRLTIYTCTGFLDSKRLVITAFPSAVEKV